MRHSVGWTGPWPAGWCLPWHVRVCWASFPLCCGYAAAAVVFRHVLAELLASSGRDVAPLILRLLVRRRLGRGSRAHSHRDHCCSHGALSQNAHTLRFVLTAPRWRSGLFLELLSAGSWVTREHSCERPEGSSELVGEG